MANDPLSQFNVYKIVEIPPVLGVDLSITNVTVWTALVALSVAGFFALAGQKASVVPNRVQSAAEVVYEFIANMIRDTIGGEGMRYFPYVFTLFMFILMANLLGLIPMFFTVTSHIAITLTLAVMTIVIVVCVGLARQGFGFFAMFAPPGLPIFIYPLIIPIEIISFLSRPITLGVRLFANMLAGHILLKVFGGFVVSLGALGAGGVAVAALPLFTASAVTALELLVAFLQAYVFAILTTMYLNEVVHGHH